MTTSQSITSIHRNPIALLDAEWARMVYSPRVLRTVNSWGLRPTPFTSLDEVLVAIGFRGAKCDLTADRMLAQVVRHAATDELAARIVLQRVIPPMLAIARRRGHIRSIGYNDALGMVLSHAWEVIRTYPIERRPAKIAVNIVRDIEYFAFVRGERRRQQFETGAAIHDATLNQRSADLLNHEDPYGSSTGRSHSEVELAFLLQSAREHNMSEKSRAVFDALTTQTLDEFAAAHGITRRTARGWLSDAANELRVRTQCAA